MFEMVCPPFPSPMLAMTQQRNHRAICIINSDLNSANQYKCCAIRPGNRCFCTQFGGRNNLFQHFNIFFSVKIKKTGGKPTQKC